MVDFIHPYLIHTEVETDAAGSLMGVQEMVCRQRLVEDGLDMAVWQQW